MRAVPLSVTPAPMPIKPFMPIQFINPLEIMLVCWVSEFNTRFIAKWQLHGACFQYYTISLRLHSTILLLLSLCVLFVCFKCIIVEETARGNHSHFHKIVLYHLGMQSRDAGPSGSHLKRAQLHEELPSYTDRKPEFEDQSPLPLLPGLFPGMPPPLLASGHPTGQEQDNICNQPLT